MAKETGQTKDVGFQFGIRKTFPVSLEKTWDLLFSKEGVAIWLGKISDELELKKSYRTLDGVEGIVRVLKPCSHVRLNWKKKDWKNVSTVQIRVIQNKEKTTISIHQEKLINSKQRDEMKKYWSGIMAKISHSMNEISQCP